MIRHSQLLVRVGTYALKVRTSYPFLLEAFREALFLFKISESQIK
jgi:hypothetical protein